MSEPSAAPSTVGNEIGPQCTPLISRLTPHAPRPSLRWLLPDTDSRIPHELQGLVLYISPLSSLTASSRVVGEPGTGAYVAKDGRLDYAIPTYDNLAQCFGQEPLFRKTLVATTECMKWMMN